MKFPPKIFNRCKSITHSKIIYKSSNGGIYRFCGIRDKRVGNESVIYSISNSLSNKHLYVKGIQKIELETLWQFLTINKQIKTSDFRRLCPELYKEGGCCFLAFYGIINSLYPKLFVKTRGLIKIK